MKPEILALITLVAGLVLARAASVGVGLVLDAIGRRAARLTTTDDSLLTPRLVRVTRTAVFWLLFGLTVVIALAFAGVPVLDRFQAALITMIPTLLVAFAIVLGGHLGGLLAQHFLSIYLADGTGSAVIPGLVRGAILAVALVVALQQFGINVSFLTELALLGVAIAGGAIGLAYALGARQLVSNLLARRELEQYRVGDVIAVDGVSGTIVAMTATSVRVATHDGITAIPASRFAETAVESLSESGNEESGSEESGNEESGNE